MTSRSDGTNTTTYAWDEDNRLTLVTLPSSATVAYTYDVKGRMLTRTDSTGTTYFTWDGWNMVAELAPNGTQTRYYAPNGELLYFERETATTDRPAAYGSAYYGQNYYGALVYSVVSDALGSVRRIVDAYNNVVSTFDYDAWGNQLASTSDPLGFPYRFVGGAGVRWDAGTGLYYCRQRWYDPTLQRFISRDVLDANNRYAYCFNNPTVFVDASGLAPQDPLTNTAPAPANPGVDYLPGRPFQPGTFSVNSVSALNKAEAGCGTNCFLICVRDLDRISPVTGNRARHPFLVFPGEAQPGHPDWAVFAEKSLTGGGQGSPTAGTHDDYHAFEKGTYNISCKKYCVGKDGLTQKGFNAILASAKQGAATHGYDYPESINWVNQVTNKDGFTWKGYGGPPIP